MTLPSPETMLAYASILEKPKYDDRGFRLATGEIIEAACTALRHCAHLTDHAQASPSRKQIEAVIDDYLGNIDATYEDSRQRCAQAIVDLYAVSSTHRCICQEQHRRGYCTEPGCPFSSTNSGDAT